MKWFYYTTFKLYFFPALTRKYVCNRLKINAGHGYEWWLAILFLSTLGDITGYRSTSHVCNALHVYNFMIYATILIKKASHKIITPLEIRINVET